MSSGPTTNTVNEVVDLVWGTAISLPLAPSTDAPGPWAESAMEAQVQITGAWQGAVVVHASPTLVGWIAQRMFQLGDVPPGLDDMRDAFGELANMIGGNIKGIVSDGGAFLSMPAVVQGRHYEVTIPGTALVARCEFLCDGQPLVVSVLQALPAQPGSGRVH